jgi:signal transduction histidine kinase
MRSDGQTALLISDDPAFCRAARQNLKLRSADVRVPAFSHAESALLIMEQIAPNAILLAEETVGEDGLEGEQRLKDMVAALSMYAPVAVLGNTKYEPRIATLLARGSVEYIAREDGYMNAAMESLERYLRQATHSVTGMPRVAKETSQKDFGEVLRHELNNPLTGILGNAELLLADITRKNDGRLPSGGQERVETIAALAVRLRETVRQLSQEWETRQHGDKEAVTMR